MRWLKKAMSEKMKISWRKWRLGFFLAFGSAMLNGLAVLACDANWKAVVASFAVAVGTSLKSYVTQFPIENIEDTQQIRKPD